MKKLFFFLLVPSALFSQGYFYNYYTVKDGLSSDNVYKVIQDNKGYIWFATDFGVSKYDGMTFQNFSTNEGVADNEVLSIFQDKSGRVWFLTFNGKPCFYLEGKIYNAENHELLKQVNFENYLNKVYEDSTGNIWLSSIDKVVRINFNEKKVTSYKEKALFFHENKDGDVLFYSGKNFYYNSNQKSNIYLTNNQNFNYALNIKANFQLKNGGILYGNDNWLNYKKPNSLEIESVNTASFLHKHDQIISVYENEGLYITTNNGVILLQNFQNGGSKTNVERLLSGRNTTSTLKDHQGNIWVSTTNGVYKIPEKRIKKVDNLDSNILSINSNGKHLVCAGNNNKITILNIDNFKIESEFKTSAKPKKIINHNEDFFIVNNKGALRLKNLRHTPVFDLFSLKDIVAHKQYYYLADASGLYRIPNHLVYRKDYRLGEHLSNPEVVKLMDARPFSIFKTATNILVSTTEGVFKLDGVKATKVLTRNSVFNYRVTSILTNDGVSVLGTDGNGLFFYKNDSLLYNLNEKNGLLSNQIKSIFLYNKKLCVVTKKGAQFIDQNHKIQSIDHLTFKALSVNASLFIKGRLYLATSQGVIYSDLQNFRRKKRIRSEIKATILGDNLNHNDTLDYDENPIIFNFKRFDFSLNPVGIEYRLLPTDKRWIKSGIQAVSYQNLPAGTYTFQLGQKGSVINSLSFTINAPYWKTTWFIGTVLLALLAFAYSLYKIILRYNLNKAKKEHEFNLMLVKAEQDALKAQMNPHFIFNALNAIQNLVLKNKTNEACLYLGNFSKLVRSILNNARNFDTTISREIEFLNLYLNLESLRFSEKFGYAIRCGSGLNKNLSIPSMIVQPFVENSIIHGFSDQKENDSPTLDIIFYEENEFICCNIVDNGRGFRQKNEKKDSLGLKIIEDRLRLYDSSGKSNFTIDSGDNGTLVKLKIHKRVEGGNR